MHYVTPFIQPVTANSVRRVAVVDTSLDLQIFRLSRANSPVGDWMRERLGVPQSCATELRKSKS